MMFSARIPYMGDGNLVLHMPQLAVLVSIDADRPGAWFRGPLGPYEALFSGINFTRNFELVKVPENPMKTPFCFGVFWGVKFLRFLFTRVDSRII